MLTTDQALMLMQTLGLARDHAVVAFMSHDEDQRRIYGEHCLKQMTNAAKAAGLELVHRPATPAPPANVGLDDGLQCDAAGNLCGVR